MRILLVNPKPTQGYTVYGPSLGLCYLSAYLKANGFPQVEGIDLNTDTQAEFESAIIRSDLVGIYCSTKALNQTIELAQKARNAGKVVVVGGPHPSVLPEEVMAAPAVDYVVLAEGEETFLALANSLKIGGSFQDIDGLGYKQNGEIIINPRKKYIEDLDSIPFPDRKLFNFDYSKVITFCATRGCPYKCSNCQPALSMQTCKFRLRSVENVLDELKQVAVGKTVHFVDNDLTVNKRWIRKLCESILSEGLHFSWGCQGRINTLNADIMSLMKKAGCIGVGVGIESGSQELLDTLLRKQLSLVRAKEVISESCQIGLPLHGWFIVGIPGETKVDMEKTMEFALSHPFATIGFSIGTPWPGTLFYQRARENGWLTSDNWENYNEKRHSCLRTNDWGPEDIQLIRERMFREFRKKGWVVDASDFFFVNPSWGRGPLKTILYRQYKKFAFFKKNILKR